MARQAERAQGNIECPERNGDWLACVAHPKKTHADEGNDGEHSIEVGGGEVLARGAGHLLLRKDGTQAEGGVTSHSVEEADPAEA